MLELVQCKGTVHGQSVGCWTGTR